MSVTIIKVWEEKTDQAIQKLETQNHQIEYAVMIWSLTKSLAEMAQEPKDLLKETLH